MQELVENNHHHNGQRSSQQIEDEVDIPAESEGNDQISVSQCIIVHIHSVKELLFTLFLGISQLDEVLEL